MAFDTKTVKSLRRFANTVVVFRDNHPLVGRWLSVPHELKDTANAAGLDPDLTFRFDPQDEAAWGDAFSHLRKEPDLDHLNDRELTNDLEAFFWRLTINHAQSKDAAARSGIVNQFIREYEDAVQAYQVIIRIEHLDIGEAPIAISDVRIRTVADSDIAEWYPNGNAGPFFDELPLSPGDVIAVTEESGPTPEVVRDRAQAKIDLSLEALRVSISGFRIRIYDSQLRFMRGHVALMTGHAGGPIVWWSISHGDRPLEPGLSSKHLEDWTRANLQRLDVIWSRTANNKLLADCERAIRWSGRSIRAGDFDDKLVALCTAQECLLSSKSAGLKTADLAIRAMILGHLFGEGFTHPNAIVGLYKIRSDVVHGSQLGMASEKMYRMALHHTLDVLYQILHLIECNPDLTTKHKLITYLDGQDCLDDCLTWCQRQDPDDTMDLQEEIQRRIECRSS